MTAPWTLGGCDAIDLGLIEPERPRLFDIGRLTSGVELVGEYAGPAYCALGETFALCALP